MSYSSMWECIYMYQKAKILLRVESAGIFYPPPPRWIPLPRIFYVYLYIANTTKAVDPCLISPSWKTSEVHLLRVYLLTN